MQFVRVQKLRDDAILPTYGSDYAAGADLAIPEDWTIPPGETLAMPLGYAVEIPRGYEWQIRPRSGLSIRTQLRVPNSPGTIDSDYRGEVAMIGWNPGDTPITFRRGDRVAQAILAPVVRAVFEPVDSLSDTVRGYGGFGSTGTGLPIPEAAEVTA